MEARFRHWIKKKKKKMFVATFYLTILTILFSEKNVRYNLAIVSYKVRIVRYKVTIAR